MKVVEVALSRIKPYERNAKKHPREQIARLVDQIKANGFDVPIVVDRDFVIIKGHGRYLALKELKAKNAYVIIRSDLSEEQVRTARLADNKLAETGWDIEALKFEFEDLKDLGIDFELTGFDSIFTDNLTAKNSAVVTNLNDEWKGMPSYDHTDKTPVRQLIVSFASEEDVVKFSKLVEQTITEKTRSLWYPKAEIETMMDKRYE